MSLPSHRRALYGRTWPSMYREADFDPIERPERSARLADMCIAAIFVAVLAWVALTWGMR